MYRLTDVGAVLLGSLAGRQATDAGSATGR
jgi:hypothetical protein